MALCNVDAAVAVLQVKKLDTMISLRKTRRKLIDDIRKDHIGGDLLNPVVKPDLSGPPEETDCVFTKYVLTANTDGEGNHKLTGLYCRIFEEAGIEIFPLYEPIHLKARYRRDGKTLKNTERISPVTFQVPLEPSMSNKDFDHVIDAYRRFMTAVSHCKCFSQSTEHSTREPIDATS
jgi:dTDP-4-amino-4,6-dideoxygalactose transaminase